MTVVNDGDARGPADAGFEELAQAARPALVRAARSLTGHRAEAEDAVQASLLKAMSAWPRVAGQERWRQQAYLRQIVINTCRSSWRKWGSRMHPGELAEQAQPSRAELVEDRLAVLQALSRLPARQRAVLVLRYYEDLSEAEIAARLGCAPGTVKSSAARALRTLRDEFYEALAGTEAQPAGWQDLATQGARGGRGGPGSKGGRGGEAGRDGKGRHSALKTA